MLNPHSLHEQPLATASCTSPLSTLCLQRCFSRCALRSFDVLSVVGRRQRAWRETCSAPHTQVLGKPGWPPCALPALRSCWCFGVKATSDGKAIPGSLYRPALKGTCPYTPHARLNGRVGMRPMLRKGVLLHFVILGDGIASGAHLVPRPPGEL